MAVYNSELFDAKYGFGGNGRFVDSTADENPFNLTGRTEGGCVEDGSFREGQFFLNVKQAKSQSDSLRRDYIPWIMNYFTRQSLVNHVESQSDYASFARALENIPSFTQPNIHGSGHFGVGGVFGTLGNSALSPRDPLFYLHHYNLDRVLWKWQRKDLPGELHQVGGPITPMDYGGKNVTLDFKINIGKLASDVTLKELLHSQGRVLCYGYHGL